MSDSSKSFSQEEIQAIKNDIVFNSEKTQIDEANMLAQLLSEDILENKEDRENLYLSILSYYGKLENKKELDSLILKLAGPNS